MSNKLLPYHTHIHYHTIKKIDCLQVSPIKYSNAQCGIIFYILVGVTCV